MDATANAIARTGTEMTRTLPARRLNAMPSIRAFCQSCFVGRLRASPGCAPPRTGSRHDASRSIADQSGIVTWRHRGRQTDDDPATQRDRRRASARRLDGGHRLHLGSRHPGSAPASAAAATRATSTALWARQPDRHRLGDPAITPVHLRLVDPDDKDRPSQPYIDEFLRVVKEGSGGAMIVDVLYGVGGTTTTGREKVVTDMVMSGDVELAIAPVRAWSDAGVTSVQALQAPLLIDSDTLVTAVAKDPLVQPMLAGMSDDGLVGITVWPEDLRHPFAWDSTVGPLLAADFKGANIWTLPSKLQAEVFETFGATAVYQENPDITDGTLRGAETGLATGAYTIGGSRLRPATSRFTRSTRCWSPRTPHGAGSRRPSRTCSARPHRPPPTRRSPSTPLMPKRRRVLPGRGPGRPRRSRECRNLRQRGPADDRSPGAGSGHGDCHQGHPGAQGHHAGRGDRRRVRAVDQRHYEAHTGPAGSGTTLIPDGVYRFAQTKDQLLAQGVNTVDAGNNAGTWTMTTSGGTGTWVLDHTNGSGKETCALSFAVRDDRVRIVCQDFPAEWFDVRWALAGDKLTLKFVDTFDGLEYNRAASEVILGGPWTKVE